MTKRKCIFLVVRKKARKKAELAARIFEFRMFPRVISRVIYDRENEMTGEVIYGDECGKKIN